jgi:hypothetical protein
MVRPFPGSVSHSCMTSSNPHCFMVILSILIGRAEASFYDNKRHALGNKPLGIFGQTLLFISLHHVSYLTPQRSNDNQTICYVWNDETYDFTKKLAMILTPAEKCLSNIGFRYTVSLTFWKIVNPSFSSSYCWSHVSHLNTVTNPYCIPLHLDRRLLSSPKIPVRISTLA